MVRSVKDSDHSYEDYQKKFHKYAESIKKHNFEGGHRITLAKKDGKDKTIEVAAAISKLMHSYRKLGQYENLSKSGTGAQLDQILNSDKIKKEFPVKRLIFKVRKFSADLLSRFQAFRGKLKTPEITPSSRPVPESPVDAKGNAEKILDHLGDLDHKGLFFHENNLFCNIKKSTSTDAVNFLFRKKLDDGAEQEGILRFYLDGNQVHIKQFSRFSRLETDVVTLPLSELTKEKILEVVDNHFGFTPPGKGLKSNAEKILEHLGDLDHKGLFFNENDMFCDIKKSTATDAVNFLFRKKLDDGAEQKGILRFYLDKDQVHIKQFFRFDRDEIDVVTLPLSELTTEKIFEVVDNHFGFTPPGKGLKSNAEKILEHLGDLDHKGLIVFNENDMFCNIKKSMSTDAVNFLFRKKLDNGAEQEGILRFYLDGNQVHIKQFSHFSQLETDVVTLPLSELTKEKILEVVDNHFGFTPTEIAVKGNAEKILDQLGNANPDGFAFSGNDMLCVVKKSAASDTVKLAFRKDLGGGKIAAEVLSFHLDKDQVLIKESSSQRNVATVPLAEFTQERILAVVDNYIGFKPEKDLRPDAEQILAMLGNPDAKKKIDFGDGYCYIRKSSSTEAVTLLARNITGEEAVFRLYLDKDQVYLRQLLAKGEATVAVLPLKEVTQDKVIELALKHSSFSEDFGRGDQTFMARMLASVMWTAEDIKLEAIKRGFDPAKRVEDYPMAMMEDFLKHYDARKNVIVSPQMTIEKLIKDIEKSKEEGTLAKETHAAMSYMLGKYLKVVPPQDRKFFETLHQRLEDQFNYVFKEGAQLKKLLAPPALTAQANQIAGVSAQNILKKASSPEYQEVGVFVSGGWFSVTHGGHHINLEVRKVGDKFHIIASNAGSGSRNHREVFALDRDGDPVPRDDNQGITTQIFEADATEAEEILKNVLLFRYEFQESDRNSANFYALFKNAKVIEDYSLPVRPFQNIGNCGVRNIQESLFYIAQRQGKVEAVNAFQDLLTSELLAVAEHYPALKQELELKGKKPRVKPLLKGNSQLILREPLNKKDHVLPRGMKEEVAFPIGLMGAIAVTAPNLSRQQAQLVQKNGKYYLERHPRCHKDNRVGLLRGGRFQEVNGREQVEVRKGDVIQLNNYRLTVV
ncbi:MAG: hypothetical protein CK425_05465 [Parachlamydia sp.]|nr:MAG: hypothetical protein CK425_05465 [Parachlamydia sp.]